MDAVGREKQSIAALLPCAAALPVRATLSASERPASTAAKSNRETVSTFAPLNRPRFINMHFSNREPAAAHRDAGIDSRITGILGGRNFSSAITACDKVAYLSRSLIRAKSSPFAFTTHQLPLTTHASRGGTVNRPRTHVSHRKQTTGHMQGRNFPVHFLFPIFCQNPIAGDPPALLPLFANDVSSAAFGVRHSWVEARGSNPAKQTRLRARNLSRWFTRAKSSLFASTNHQSLLTNHGALPGTVTRVEAHVSRTKQTVAYASTRNVPAHAFLRLHFAPAITAAHCKASASPPQTKSRFLVAALVGITAGRKIAPVCGRKIRLRFGHYRAYNPRSCSWQVAKRRGGDRASGTNGWSSSLSRAKGDLP